MIVAFFLKNLNSMAPHHQNLKKSNTNQIIKLKIIKT